MKIALISFDGLDPRIIYNNRDRLETFDSLMSETMHGKWRTPGHTIPSYIATLTGMPYNQTNFRWDDEVEDGFARHRQTEYDFLWDILDASMTFLNMPVVYPPEEIDDAMVAGFLTPDELYEENLALPQVVQNYLNSISYVPDIHAHDTYEELGEENMIDLLCHIMNKRVEAADWLIDHKYNSDLFYGVWTSTDRWFHVAAMNGHNYMPLYEKADDILEQLLKLLPDDIPLVVFSDHGFRHKTEWEGVHKGHAYEGWYSIRHDELPNYRDDSKSIYDLFPTVVNYLGRTVPDVSKGRILFHTEEQDNQVRDRLDDLGYLE